VERKRFALLRGGGHQKRSTTLGVTKQRRLFVLSGREEPTGAATAVWGVLGIEGPDDQGAWATHLSCMPYAEDNGLWADRLERLERIGRLIDPEVIEFWAEHANGIIWEIDELEASDIPDVPDLATAVEAFVDVLLAYPLDLMAEDLARQRLIDGEDQADNEGPTV